MNSQYDIQSLHELFTSSYALAPSVIASAPGRLEVLGNHTDYNAGLTLSCAVNFRCYAAIATLDKPAISLASTGFSSPPESFVLEDPLQFAAKGHWANYILGLVAALHKGGVDVPGFALMIDSQVPRSAGVSSSAALTMSVLTALNYHLDLNLSPVEMAQVGQWAESSVVGAQTGLLDQLTSLCGDYEKLLLIDFQSIVHSPITLPPGWCFVAVDSGVKHDLTAEYNDRRLSCESSASALGVEALRDAKMEQLHSNRDEMDSHAYRCATHVLGENQRVRQATEALSQGDVHELGQLMFASHVSSQINFKNSCAELDQLVAFARQDKRCVGARLSGGGFGGISIHLVRYEDSESYREDLVDYIQQSCGESRFSAVCQIDRGANVES